MAKFFKYTAFWSALLFGVSAFSVEGFAQSALKDHNADQPIDIVADQLEVRQNEDIAIFRGAVEASQGDLRLMADTLTVFYASAQDVDNPSIARIDASGAVSISSPSESADGEWGVYDVTKRLITIGGNVTLRRGENVLVGERLEIDLTTGVTRFDGSSLAVESDIAGRVRGRFSLPDDEDDEEGEEGGEDDGDVGKPRNHR